VTHVALARDPRGGPGAVAVDRSPDALAGHLEDAAHFPGGHADGIARPRTEREVAGLLMAAARVLPIGAQSSVTGGATPTGGLLVATDRMTSIEPAGRHHYRVGAGVPLDTLQAHLREQGRWYPPTPTFTGAFVGGVIATNAAGAATFKHGTTRRWVDGLTVILPCGHVLDLVRRDVRADLALGFEIRCACGSRRFRPGTYRMPAVPKCSAGYFAEPGMDLIDLFIGAEGTLGVIVDATIRVAPALPALAFALIPAASERAGVALVRDLRAASEDTWRSGDRRGIDVAAIECLDRRCLEILREDGADRAQAVAIPEGTEWLLIVQLELPADLSAARAFDDIAGALDPSGPDSPLARFARLLARHEAFDRTELAMPGDTRRAQQLLALREAAPVGVNRRVGDAKRLADARIDKTAGDIVVPFDRFEEMLAIYREGYARRGLDYAIWGHVSDGNVHPNVIPRSWADVLAGRDAILEFGRAAVTMGGSPLAEHGVGRSSLKQQLLRLLYGEQGLDQMRAIKVAIDPEDKMAPGVIFGADES
jgi:D-lactate dehydrogenase (cytochrome)